MMLYKRLIILQKSKKLIKDRARKVLPFVFSPCVYGQSHISNLIINFNCYCWSFLPFLKDQMYKLQRNYRRIRLSNSLGIAASERWKRPRKSRHKMQTVLKREFHRYGSVSSVKLVKPCQNLPTQQANCIFRYYWRLVEALHCWRQWLV